ncbi:RDD family protein [Psychromonas sp. 14N.309.X.WAT.B.A12]|uniref:RDD family protein n=1 Tax=Psychromonas sp. 14N.309.X.WAT.B.A12 TaxID=2998322 RepID=UPI0025B1FED4|nr:RDD family protein [Psychromonas sp. 14N.309.X.WAT.B.A12]MDN2664276.1 RDD family protein [Psychromonas sp. 14N.309.X.WAT.B.A12]
MAKQNKKKNQELNLAEQYQGCKRASFWRRLGAYIIDLFTIGFVIAFATALALLVVNIVAKLGGIDLSLYQDSSDYLGHSMWFLAYISLLIIAFFIYFWSCSGQTIGMKLVQLRVQNSDGSNISMTQAAIRLATSAFGLGSFMALLKDRNAFQDLWAECEVVVLPKSLNTWALFKKVEGKEK